MSSFKWALLHMRCSEVFCMCLLCFPGELSSVGCFVHKATRIVGGGPVGISEGSWMVSIQRGYSEALNILHIFLCPWRGTISRPALASGPDLPWILSVSFILVIRFSVLFFCFSVAGSVLFSSHTNVQYIFSFYGFGHSRTFHSFLISQFVIR